jgi:hypothetical protein
MTERKSLGVIVPFPRERVAKRRRVQPPPLKRIPISAGLMVFLDRMAGKEATR